MQKDICFDLKLKNIDSSYAKALKPKKTATITKRVINPIIIKVFGEEYFKKYNFLQIDY